MGHCRLWDLLALCTGSVQFCVHVHLHIACVQTHKHTCACIQVSLDQCSYKSTFKQCTETQNKEKLKNTSSVYLSLMLMHRHGWRSRMSGHAELTEETLGTFLVGQGCSALRRSRIQMSCQHSLKMCRDGPVKETQGGHTVSPYGNWMRKSIETQQSSSPAVASEHRRPLERFGMEKKRKTWRICVQACIPCLR